MLSTFLAVLRRDPFRPAALEGALPLVPEGRQLVLHPCLPDVDVSLSSRLSGGSVEPTGGSPWARDEGRRRVGDGGELREVAPQPALAEGVGVGGQRMPARCRPDGLGQPAARARRQHGSAPAKQAEQKAREAGEVAAKQLSRAAWSTLAMLLLGVALSFFVGRVALTTRRVPLA